MRARSNDLPQAGECTAHDTIEPLRFAKVLCPCLVKNDVVQGERMFDLKQEAHLLAIAVEQMKLPLGKTDCQGYPWQSGASADIKDALSVQIGHHVDRVFDRGQVVRPVPLCEQSQILA